MKDTSAASAFFRAGRIQDAWRVLDDIRHPTAADGVLKAELHLLRGSPSRAREHADAYLAKEGTEPELRARCHLVLASCLTDVGDVRAALCSARRAESDASEGRDTALVALARAFVLERSCDYSGFNASLPSAALARRSAAATTDVQARACVHLVFARLEGRVGHFHTALRHFRVGRELLTNEPNEVLSATIDLDESSVLWLMGDLGGAIALAARASGSAKEQGWVKGELVAGVNLAQFLVSQGLFAEATDQVENARASASLAHNFFKGSLADTEAQIAIHRGEFAKAREILSDPGSLGVPNWYALSLNVTANRLAIKEGDWSRAVASAEASELSARVAGVEHLARVFRMQRQEALALQDKLDPAEVDIVFGNAGGDFGGARPRISSLRYRTRHRRIGDSLVASTAESSPNSERGWGHTCGQSGYR